MVPGLDRFRAHFAGPEDSYALIGGVACSLILGGGRSRFSRHSRY